MSVPLTGTGGLFTRLGLIAGAVRSINSFIGTANLTAANIKSVGSFIDGIYAQFPSSDQNLVNGLYSNRDSARTQLTNFKQALQALAKSVAIQMANDDTPLSQQTISAALGLIISQMKSGAQSVNKPTVSASVAAGTNTGNGALVAGVLGSNGIQLDYVLAEAIKALCTTDSQTGGVTAGQERFTVSTPSAEADPLQWDYPLGSGVTSLSLSAVDATVNATAGNLLNNGSGNTYSNPNQPDNWIVDVATIGTTVLQASGGNVYKGTKGNSYVGNGAELTGLYQSFGVQPSTASNSGGTILTLAPSTQYAVNIATKVSSVPVAGVLEVSLRDGTGAYTSDANGVQNKLQISLPGETTSFALHNALFRTPAVNPTTGYRLYVKLTTALDNAKTVYWGHLGMQQVTPVYAGGPVLALFSGNTNFVAGDLYTVTAANNLAGVFQTYLERIFGLRSLGLQFPSSGTPTISDSLVA